ncbi:hypothetical protein BDW59DRAFT_160813 [Aspergillus cavernicola]|uniref:Uncharacterized protein n=1 Tax=Aspergillus cavernicola TaxID=176166 RepID=A0ABR4IFT3_9EURO
MPDNTKSNLEEGTQVYHGAFGDRNQDVVRDLFDDHGRIKDAPPMDQPGLASEAFLPGLDESVRDKCTLAQGSVMRSLAAPSAQ